MDSPLDLGNLPPEVAACIRRLKDYKPVQEEFSIAHTPNKYKHYPAPRFAAVLVLLYYRAGRLRVLLTTRSKRLRSHPGQVALPGGKSEPEDGTPETTARREAFEEISLPLDSPFIWTLCHLPPFVSLWKLVVTPVVAYLSDLSLLDGLVPHELEVDHIFDHPLEMILDPSLNQGEPLSEKGTDDWPYEDELHNTSDLIWQRQSQYRMHRLRSKLNPIKGLTADILVLAAEIAFIRPPAYEKSAPNQVSSPQLIDWVMEEAKLGVKPGRADGKSEPPNPFLFTREAETQSSGASTPTLMGTVTPHLAGWD